MLWRQMSAWMLYVVQTSFSGQATSPTPLSTQQPTATATTPPPADTLMLPLAERALPGMNGNCKQCADSLQTGVNQLEGVEYTD